VKLLNIWWRLPGKNNFCTFSFTRLKYIWNNRVCQTGETIFLIQFYTAYIKLNSKACQPGETIFKHSLSPDWSSNWIFDDGSLVNIILYSQVNQTETGWYKNIIMQRVSLVKLFCTFSFTSLKYKLFNTAQPGITILLQSVSPDWFIN